jgi:TRAP-type C4-dicarboxylate transport system permease small subunit
MVMLAKIVRVFDRIIDGCGIAGGVLIFLVVITVNWEVITRYFLGNPTSWVIETAEYALLYFAFLVAAFVLKREEHVRLDLILGRLSPKSQNMLNIITSIICSITCLLLTWYGASTVLRLFQSGDTTATTLMVPKFIIVAVIPWGGLLLFIQSMRRTFNYVQRWRSSLEDYEKQVDKPEIRL